jgi:hypothetical protein
LERIARPEHGFPGEGNAPVIRLSASDTLLRQSQASSRKSQADSLNHRVLGAPLWTFCQKQTNPHKLNLVVFGPWTPDYRLCILQFLRRLLALKVSTGYI